MADHEFKFYVESRIEIEMDTLIDLIVDNAVELDSFLQDKGIRLQRCVGTNWAGNKKWTNVTQLGSNKPP